MEASVAAIRPGDALRPGGISLRCDVYRNRILSRRDPPLPDGEEVPWFESRIAHDSGLRWEAGRVGRAPAYRGRSPPTRACLRLVAGAALALAGVRAVGVGAGALAALAGAVAAVGRRAGVGHAGRRDFGHRERAHQCQPG